MRVCQCTQQEGKGLTVLGRGVCMLSSNRNIHCLLKEWNLRGELLTFEMPDSCASQSVLDDVQLYAVTLDQTRPGTTDCQCPVHTELVKLKGT